MENENILDKLLAKIVAKQKLINLENDQEKKNELIQQLNVLNMRKEMEETNTKIKQLRDTN